MQNIENHDLKVNILCAGIGTRFKPFSLITPKPLFCIGGVPIVERTIRQLHEHGITDITLVVGYKHQAFNYLKKKYSVELIISNEFDKNNHSSLQLVSHRLNNSLIIDGDLYMHYSIVPLIVKTKSQFISQKINHAPEWAMCYDENGKVISVEKNKLDGWALSGVSFWTGEAAQLLATEIYNCEEDEYWEDAALRVLKKTSVYITKAKNFSTEIDSLYEAISTRLISHDDLATQCCEKNLPVKLKGLTNSTYKISIKNTDFVLRIPGEGTEKIIDRKNEEYIMNSIENYDIGPSSTFYNGGIKLTNYLNGYDILTPDTITPEVLEALAIKLKKLHAIPYTLQNNHKYFSTSSEIELYEKLTNITVIDHNERKLLYKLAELMDNDQKTICHRDLLLENILIKNHDVQLIDFEYAAITSIYWDIASFLTESRIEGSQRAHFLESYAGLDTKKVLEAELVVDYIWTLWGFYNNYIPYARERLSYFNNLLKKYTALYL